MARQQNPVSEIAKQFAGLTSVQLTEVSRKALAARKALNTKNRVARESESAEKLEAKIRKQEAALAGLRERLNNQGS